MKLISIQILRALGAWFVAVAHWHTCMKAPGFFLSPFFEFFNFSGPFGVMIFFTISGFVICLSTKNKNDFFIFWIHRLARLVPLWWFLLFLFSILIMCFPVLFIKHPVPFTGTNFVSSLFFMSAFRYPLIISGWSLNTELLFYICFSFGFGFKGKYRILICSALIVLYLFSRNSLLPPIVYEVFPYHGQHYDHLTPCFVYGMIIFYLYERSEKNVSLLSASIFLLLGVCGVKVFSLVNQGLPCALIIWSMISLEPWIRKNLKYFSWANALGDWSYSTYLNHLFFMYLSKWLYDENILRNLHLNFIFYILCIITFSYLSFLFLEKPAGLFLKRVLENGYFYTRRSLHELAKPLLNFSRQLFPLKTN